MKKETAETQIYLDNVRGFQDTFISLKDVNFLVGENSTGKTSLLYIVNLLSEPFYKLFESILNESFRIFCHKDLVSAESKETNFKIGLKKDKYSWIIEYCNLKGLPAVCKFVIQLGSKTYFFKLEDNKLKYRDTVKVDIFNQNIYKEEFIATKEECPPPLIRMNLLLVASMLIEKNMKTTNLKYPMLISDCLYNTFKCVLPLRSEPKYIYDTVTLMNSKADDHSLLKMQESYNNPNMVKPKKQLNYIGKLGGLFKEACVNKYPTKDPYAPFQINAVLYKEAINISNLGDGVSQSLPILIDLLYSSSDVIGIRQPEVHLHPKAQAALGELFFNVATRDKCTLLIETHSDFIINRFRQRMNKNANHKIKTQVLFFYREKGFNKVTPIEIYKNGVYSEQQPKKYRDFFIKESLENLSF